MSWLRKAFVILAAVFAATAAPLAAASPPTGHATPTRIVAGLAGGAGSAIGPDGALYVTETEAGRITRVDLRTGHTSTFADGLPASVIGLGGAMDVAFLGRTAYALVTLVGPDVGGANVVGVYRIDGPRTSTVVADIGAFALAHPPSTDFFVPTGVQYALEPYRNGFLVTDGHHNRVLRVGLDGTVGELVAFPNIVPTGLATRGDTVYMAEAGPVPHLPQDGKIVSFHAHAPVPTEVAVGGRLLVDVERGRGNTLYALSQGVFPAGNPPGSPALPGTGRLLKVDRGGGFTAVVDGLDRPTSLELVDDAAYVVTLGGEVWRIDDV